MDNSLREAARLVPPLRFNNGSFKAPHPPGQIPSARDATGSALQEDGGGNTSARTAAKVGLPLLAYRRSSLGLGGPMGDQTMSIASARRHSLGSSRSSNDPDLPSQGSWSPLLKKILGTEALPRSNQVMPVSEEEAAVAPIGDKAATTTAWHPMTRYHARWDLLMASFILFNCVSLPLRIAFSDDKIGPVVVFDFLINVLFVIDCWVLFNTGYFDSKTGEYELDIQKVRSNYLHGWFTVDLLAALPVDVALMLAFRGKKMSRLVRLPRVLRLLRLPRFFRIISLWQDLMPISGNRLRMAKFVFSVLVFAHLDACILFYVAQLQADFSPEVAWLTRYSLNEAKHSLQYTFALLMALSNMVSGGYGPSAYSANTVLEMWMMILSMAFGAIFFAILVGMIVVMLGEGVRRDPWMELRLDELESYNSQLILGLQAAGFAVPPLPCRENVANLMSFGPIQADGSTSGPAPEYAETTNFNGTPHMEQQIHFGLPHHMHKTAAHPSTHLQVSTELEDMRSSRSKARQADKLRNVRQARTRRGSI